MTSEGAPPAPRPSRSRQQQVGSALRQETRRVLLAAAAELFAERGYAATSVSAIAERAGVSLQTLYLAWGSKRELLRAFVEHALSGSTRVLDQDEWARRISAEIGQQSHGSPDPRRQLRALAHQFRVIADAAGDRPAAALAWQLCRDAAGADPSIAAEWRALQLLRRGTFAHLLSTLPPNALRPGLTAEQAVDTAWAIASPETYDLLVRHAGYPLDQYEQWVADTLIAALLPNGS